jgi:hypothetical protein
MAVMLGTGEVSAGAFVWRKDSPRWIPITNIIPMPSSVKAQVHPAGAVVVNVSNTNIVGGALSPRLPSNSMGTASLAVGIISLVLFCVPFVGTILGVIGLVLGIIGLNVGKARNLPVGTSIGGIVCSGTAVIGSFLFLIVAVASGK